MTRYYVDISPDLINDIIRLEGAISMPDGFRLIERYGPRFKHIERWLVEDEYAPEELEGFLISPVFQKNLIDGGPEYTVTVSAREIMPRP